MLEAELLAVGGREDARHAAPVELLDLLGHDHPAPPAVDAHVAAPPGAQAVEQVGEVLHVAALVGADGHGLNVFGHHGGGHLVDRTVVAEVDDLGPLTLEEPAHDVDGRVVAVEEGGRGHHPHRVHRAVERRRLIHGHRIV